MGKSPGELLRECLALKKFYQRVSGSPLHMPQRATRRSPINSITHMTQETEQKIEKYDIIY
jgi:hypothetical protein